MSAYEALLARLYLREKLTDSQKLQLHARLFPCLEIEEVPPELYHKVANKLLLKSGMPELEQVILLLKLSC